LYQVSAFAAARARRVQTAEPQQGQAKSEGPTGALDSPDLKQRIRRPLRRASPGSRVRPDRAESPL